MSIYQVATGEIQNYSLLKKISIGTDALNDLRFDPAIDGNTSQNHAVILHGEYDYVLKDKGSAKGTLVNNRVVSEIVLKDGDLIEFGAGGPKVRFRIKADEADIYKPLTEILEDSLGIARTSQKGRLITATSFLKHLVWEAFTQSSHTFKIYLLRYFLS